MRDPDVGISRTKTLCKVPFAVVFDGVAGMSRDLGRDVPDLEKLYARNFGLLFRTLITLIRMTKKGGEFKGGSRHDRNRHNRRNRQNRQNRHGCLFVLYFVGQGEGAERKVFSRTAKTVKTAKTVMKATPLKPNPPFPSS